MSKSKQVRLVFFQQRDARVFLAVPRIRVDSPTLLLHTNKPNVETTETEQRVAQKMLYPRH